MKFLCLPGAYGSAKVSRSLRLVSMLAKVVAGLTLIAQNFRVQLGPLADELERRGLATFAYSQGSHEVEPPAGWEDYFGARPLYRFVDTYYGDTFENLRRLRHIPHSISAEDAIRMVREAGEPEDWFYGVCSDALDDLFKRVEEHPDIDAVIGYSEGAVMGASLILEEALRAQRTGYRRRIKVNERPASYDREAAKLMSRFLSSSVCHLHIWLAAVQARERQPRRRPAR